MTDRLKTTRCEGGPIRHFFTYYQEDDYIIQTQKSTGISNSISFYSFKDNNHPSGYTSFTYNIGQCTTHQDFNMFVPLTDSMAFVERMMKLRAFL
jgi:hypothetical protein